MSTLHRNVALDMIHNPNNYQIGELIDVLRTADSEYHNDQESFIEDNEYDALRLITSKIDPTNEYFIGVGSDVRGGKIKLPFEMGSLDQVEIGDITDWVGSWNLQNEEVVISDKMDGTSTMIIYGDDGKPQIAYSRGNGIEGADISRHIFQIKNVPKQVSGRMVVRAEVELTETAFKFLRSKVKRHSSTNPYKNARNMVAGLMNRKENPDIVYEHLTVVAYEIVGFDGDKLEQLETLEEYGFNVVEYTLLKGSEITDNSLSSLLNARRDSIDYKIDGLVLDVDNQDKRAAMNPTRDTLNPAYSIKYKVADDSNMAIATIVGVKVALSKHGYIKPTIEIEPTELVGVTVRNCTGFNMKFIRDNKIQPGCKIHITRSGDVIPLCLSVAEEGKLKYQTYDDWFHQNIKNQLGNVEYDWNETGVDLVLVDKNDNDTVQINQLIDFFEKIEAPYLKEGNIRKLYEAGFVEPKHFIRDLSKRQLVSIIGENGNKIYNGLKTKLTNIPAYKLLGAFSTERGLGVRKFKKLQKAFGLNDIINGQLTTNQIVKVDGFEEKTATKAVIVMDQFSTFLSYIHDFYSFEQEVDTSSGSMVGQKVVFTGFRDKELQAAVESAGGDIQSSVSGKTTILVAKNPNSGSGKIKKAADKGVNVIGIDDLRSML